MTKHLSTTATVEQLHAIVECLRQENADLRASAVLWKRLYEQALPNDTPAEFEYVTATSEQRSPSAALHVARQ